MRGAPEIKVIMHWPDEPTVRNEFYKKLQDFYIEQVEKQIEKYGLKKEQKIKVLDTLTQRYADKMKTESIE